MKERKHVYSDGQREGFHRQRKISSDTTNGKMEEEKKKKYVVRREFDLANSKI
jgi:hypothetical protein